MTPWLALIACTPSTTDATGSRSAELQLATGSERVASNPVDWPDGDTVVERVPAAEEPPEVDPTDDVFSLVVHEVTITLGPEARQQLGAEPYEHVEGSLVFDGEELPSVGIRLKGRLGSYRSLTGKAGFKVDVNQFDEELELLELTHLNINNLVQDYAMLHDRIAYTLYREVGVPAPRVGYAWLNVDGQDYGLYALVEDYDGRFVRRWFEDGGNLYDGDYWLADNWSNYELIDFVAGQDGLFDLDYGTDVGLTDIRGVSDAVDEVQGTQFFDERVGEVVDIDNLVRYLAAEIWLGQWDGYAFNSNNYRVYFDPTDGLARIMPWDHDQCFYESTWITSPVSVLAMGCYQDLSCKARLVEAIQEVCDAADNLDLEAEIDSIVAAIQPHVAADPRREYSAATVASYQQEARLWVRSRRATLAATFGF